MRTKINIENFVLVKNRNHFGAQLPSSTNTEDIFHLQLMLENQFITPEEISSLHLQSLIANHLHFKNQAAHASKTTIDRVIEQLQIGNTFISKTEKDVMELLDQPVRTDSQKRLDAAHKKQEQRQLLNQLLYSYNKNKQSPKDGTTSQRLLSIAEHNKFIKSMRKDNEKRKELRQKRQRSELERSAIKEQKERKSNEERRMNQIQRKKESIKQNLKKMRQNHEKLLATQKQSKAFFNKIRKKKRLYQQMKQNQDQKSMEAAREVERRLVEHRQWNKFDITALINHEKQYSEWKQQKSLQKSRTKTAQKQIYKAPPRPTRLNNLIQAQNRVRNKTQQKKRQIEQKIKRTNEYTSIVKDRLKTQSSKRSKTIATDRGNQSADHLSVKQNVDRIYLGNQYMKLSKLLTKKKSKTQQRYFNPEQSTPVKVNSTTQKVRVSTLAYIPEEKRQKHIEKKKIQQIEKLLKMDNTMSDAQKLQRIKIADERVSIQLRKKEEGLKARYSTQVRQNTLSILLSTIRAKINLINENKDSNK